jgi:hypothetical protein
MPPDPPAAGTCIVATILIGVDDTDNPASRGTGFLARALANECASRGMRPLGVSRHQFLVDDRIPYTSHNSGSCVALRAQGVESAAFAFEFVAARAADGSDPGVCIAQSGRIGPEIIAFGKAAAREVLETSDALRLGAGDSIRLKALGGTGQGVIGALASVGLREAGDDGRFIDLPGLRELPARVDAGELLRLGIRLAHSAADRAPAPSDAFDTLGWVRPRLIGGRPVLPVEWSDQNHAWIPVDRKGHTAAE